ncbi:alpha/beta fold hydrolase [Pseudonocardia adelaidensis]|uniref:Alpha/beta fold hydrolase n=1 Tax=Pseudonocardia adelaidensis TaxID=648754 RepID=A0ABP9NFY8_9PSEU
MGEYLDIGGHPTWVDQRGSGAETVLLLHGGMSNSDLLLDAVGAPLAERHRLVAFDRRGHGYTADTPAPFHYEDMAAETIGVLEAVVGQRAHLVGWSDGGIICLLVALRRPDLVDRMVLIGANFHFDGVVGGFDLPEDSPFASAILEAYAERSPDGGEHFGEIFGKFMAMVTTEPTLSTDDLGRITAPTLVMAGDDDAVLLPHTCEMYEALPAGQLSIVPGASHALPIERPDVTARTVLDFLGAEVPPATLIPVRRAGAIA